MVNILKMKVTAYSSIEDWVMGETKLVHTYSSSKCVSLNPMCHCMYFCIQNKAYLHSLCCLKNMPGNYYQSHMHTCDEGIRKEGVRSAI
jgi:hypothetical protein